MAKAKAKAKGKAKAKAEAKSPAKAKESCHCATCGKAVPESKAGFVCQHFAHGSYLTYEASKPGPSKMGDIACTACAILYEQSKRDNGGEPSAAALEEVNIHVVCLACYRLAAKRNVVTLRKDRNRGYALVPRDTHAALQGMAMQVVAPIDIGDTVKLVFVPIPSKGRDEFEMMWVTIRSAKGGAYRGALANDPQLFEPSTLKHRSSVAFDRAHIVAVEV